MAEEGVTVTDRSLPAQVAAIAALRVILGLLERHPDQVAGLIIYDRTDENGQRALHVQASIRGELPRQDISGGQEGLDPSVPPPQRSTVTSGERSLSDDGGRSR